MGNNTALLSEHEKLGARIVDFAGWNMPLHYGSQIEEHKCVRSDAGMFDVSHMTVVDIEGNDARDYLYYLLANNIDRLKKNGKALYSCMLNEKGGIIDDLIVFRLDNERYRVIVNAATREKDLAWMNRQAADFDISIIERSELAMIAVQGPHARDKAHQALDGDTAAIAAELGIFFGAEVNDLFISRTGYTGEDGYEIILPDAAAPALWRSLLDAGVRPIGLGARDTLRLEAGMNLYGTDMDESTSPLESGLGWTVSLEADDRAFIGRDSLEKQREAGGLEKFVGLVLEGRGVLRNHMPVQYNGQPAGEITSGSFSPILGKAIAMARISAEAAAESHCQIEIRGTLCNARIVKMPFVRNGTACIDV